MSATNALIKNELRIINFFLIRAFVALKKIIYYCKKNYDRKYRNY